MNPDTLCAKLDGLNQSSKMNSTTPLVDAAVNDTAFEDKNQPHTDWITAYAGREIEAKMNEARRELAHARDMLTVANETSAAADRIRIGLERELNESHAREAQLRAIVSELIPTARTMVLQQKAIHALTLSAPPVIPVEDVKPLVEAITRYREDCPADHDATAGFYGASLALESALSTFTTKHKL